MIGFITIGVLPDVVAQTNASSLPVFQDYPVRELFGGTPHPPIFATAEQRRFRTTIREGIEKGWGVRADSVFGPEQNKPGPNFAGHYIVIVWGCGAPCLRMVVCDARTGAVYNPPLSADGGGLALPVLVLPSAVLGRNPDVEYRLDSRLMIIRATPNSYRPSATSYTFYFLMQGRQWKLLRRVPITDEQ